MIFYIFIEQPSLIQERGAILSIYIKNKNQQKRKSKSQEE